MPDKNFERTDDRRYRRVLGWVDLVIKREVVSKPQVRLKGKAQADPPSLKKLWRDTRKSAVRQSTLADEHFEEACDELPSTHSGPELVEGSRAVCNAAIGP